MSELTNPTHLNPTDSSEELITTNNDQVRSDEVTDVEIQSVQDDTDGMEEVSVNYSDLNKSELLEKAEETLQLETEVALKTLQHIKPYLDAILQDEYDRALTKFIEEGGEKDDFEYNENKDIRDRFNQIYKDIKKKRADERARQDIERLENLRKKEDLLQKIKSLSEEEETELSFKQLKELQSEWKSIKNIPKEHIERLWESYQIYVHQFYDRLTIFNELKDLDRRKNLGLKIELIQKVSELQPKESAKKALIYLKKYQDEWRGIGPVPKESNEDLWTRFKQECDKIYETIRLEQAEQDKIREENLLLKKSILAKALELSNFSSTKPKEWVQQTDVANQLMEEWKKVGMIPMQYRDSIWEEFRNARNAFYQNKNTFFKKLQSERTENLKVKTLLCEKAEAIAQQPIDWNKQTEELKKLQDEWKKSGAIHDKLSDVIWKRFRTACDLFFEKKAAHYASQIEEQNQNLVVKKDLLSKLEVLLAKDDSTDIIQELKSIQESWNKTGFVPMQEKEKINKQYSELSDKVFNKFKQASDAIRSMRESNHLEAMLNSPNGLQKIKREERILMERIKGLKNDIDTWDNNLGFFSKSNKGENPMAKQIEEKIAIAQKHIAQLQDKIKNLRSFIQNQEKSANS